MQLITDIDKNIQTLLDSYFERLRKEADNNWTDAYKKAEDFYCRLLNRIYSWELYNRNYIKNNEWDIDLASIDKEITVQVTCRKNGKKTKVKDTLKGFNSRKIKQGYKQIYIAFIDDDEIDLNNWTDLNDDTINFNVLTNVITPKSIIKEISKNPNFPTQKRIEILEFLEQEINPELKGIKSIVNIKSISDKFNKDDEFQSNELFFKNKWIVLSKKEFALSKKIRSELSNNLYGGYNSYILIGNSCSGKTTFSFFTGKLIEKYTNIRCFYFKVDSTTKLSDIKNDLLILKNYFAFLIIDDIQNNIDFTDELYIELKNYTQIKTLYLSRITAKIDDQIKGQFYRRNFVLKEFYNTEIKNDETKIDDIINRRLEFYSKHKTSINFEIGDLKTIHNLINFNLLKLSILLHYWGKSGGKLSDINEQNLNEIFFETYFDDENVWKETKLTLRYASVFSLNIPFEKRINIEESESNEIFNQLVKKGLFHKLHQQDSYYVFYHTEFANLLIESIISQDEDLQTIGLDAVKHKYFVDYLNSIEKLPNNYSYILESIIENENIGLIEKIFSDEKLINKTIDFFALNKLLPFNFHYIITNIYIVNKTEFIKTIVNEDSILNLLLLYYSQQDYKIIHEFISILLKLNSPENQANKQKLIHDLNNVLPFNKIRTFEKFGFKFKNKLYDFCELAGIDSLNYNFKINDDVVSFVSSAPINELTLQILKDSNNLEITNERLYVLDFSQWMEKFYYTPFTLLGNCLSELYKTPLASKLSIDIYSNLDIDFLLSKALEYKKKPVKVSKSINELAIFKFLDGNEKIISLSNNLINDLEFKKYIENQDIDDFARMVSDFSFNIYASNTLINLFTVEQYVAKLLDEKNNLYTITQIINNLNTVSPSIATEIILGLTKTDFINEKMKAVNLNGLNEFKKFLSSYKIKLSPSKKSLSNEKLLDVFTSETDLTKIAKSIENLKSNKKLVSQVFQLPQLSVANFYENVKKNEFRINHLQQIFPKLKEADLDLCYKLYISFSDNFFIAPANRTNFQGICHTLSEFQTIDFDYSKKYNVNSAKTKNILEYLFTNRDSRLLNKAKKASMDKFLIGYVQLWKIDRGLVEKYLDPILSDKITKDESQDDINRNVNISSFGQGIRSYIELDKDRNLKIGETLFKNYFKTIKSTINSIDIRKISYGLERISILESQTDLFAFETTEILIEKCKTAKTNPDFKTGVIPELEKALKGAKGQLLLNRIKNL
jgi:hypothetical protein